MKNINDMLIQATFDNDLEGVKDLVEKGADVNYINKSKDTALLAGVRKNNIQIVKYLLENKANPNPNPNLVYALPLQEAIDTSTQMVNYNANITKEPIEMIQLLLDYGVNILLENDEGENSYVFSKGYNTPAQKLFDSILNKKNRS